ncbi:MAG: T9SS type B sorting domain-containing protein [Paludibacteraceae bacterium]|nr:T9SS type B sorting domain-containing protein [Paludibacteraceae bacterium]
MGILQRIGIYIASLIMLAGVTATSAQTLFNVYSEAHMDNKTHHNYLCMQYDQDDVGYILITHVNESYYDGNIDAALYENAEDVGVPSKALQTITDKAPKDAVLRVYRDDINPTGAARTMSKTYYVQVCKTGTNECEITEMPFDTYHTQDVPEINIEPYCYGNTPGELTTIVQRYNNDNYSWKDENNKKLGFTDFLTIRSLSAGEHKYILQNRNHECYSPGIEITLTVKKNATPHLSKTNAIYTSEDIANGNYTKSIKQKVGGDIVDDPFECDLTWVDKNGNVITDFESYVPPVPDKPGVTIDEYKVSRDCGCNDQHKTSSFYVMLYVLPKPTVSDLTFCVDDPRAANGFDAIIGETSEIGESKNNYQLEFSKNADMSGAITLNNGEEHFDYSFDVSTAGKTTYYVRQRKAADNETSEIVPFTVTVKQPVKPTLANQDICLNTTKTVSLSSISSETNIIWKDAADNVISDNISIERSGNTTVYGQTYEIVDGRRCLSETSSATIHADSLEVTISGDDVLLPGQTGKAEIALVSNGTPTIAWSSTPPSAIVGDANKKEVSVTMGSSNIILESTVTNGSCTTTKNWTIRTDLFQCPAPTADDVNLCINDTHAADGFDANITLENTSDVTSNYVLSVSKNADMSDATTLAPGETHFNYTFNVSSVGTQKVYIQQKELSRNLSSAIVPVTINVKQPVSPSFANQNICLNTTNTVSLSSISSETNIIWKDAADNIIRGNISIEKSGNTTVYGQAYEMINGEQCLSEKSSATIHADSLGATISGDDILLPEQTGKAEVSVQSSGSPTFAWTSTPPSAIVGGANQKEVSVKMGTTDITLECTITDGVCSTMKPWAISADLFKCPKPTANEVNLCINDPRAANGFDASITLENTSDVTSNYVLSVSKNADMSGATTLAPGETHFNYTFNVSSVGTQKVYIQQKELSRNLSSAIVPVTINVKQPSEPSANTATICFNDGQEVLLADLSTESNLQWYDENDAELTTKAVFSSRGDHRLSVKRYVLVDGANCWSNLTTTTVHVDSIGVDVSGDNHLCPMSSGQVTLNPTATAFDMIMWNSPYITSGITKRTASVTIGEENATLKYAVKAGVCKTSGSWHITVGTGKVNGDISFSEGTRKRTFPLSEANYISCGNEIEVETTIEHSSSSLSVKKGNKDLGTYTFDGDIAKFKIEGDGTYTVSYENDCPTSFTFKVTTLEIEPKLTTSKWSSCYGGRIAADISNISNECSIIWKKDGAQVANDTRSLTISNVSANDIGSYTYELVCDGCPFNGIVSDSKPDIYSPVAVSFTQSADTICQGDQIEIKLTATPSSDKVTYVWETSNDIQTHNNGASATLSPRSSNNFTVKINNGDCESQTVTINTKVHPQMTGDINAEAIMCEGDSTTLDASSLKAERYEWKHTDSESPIITVVPNGVENKYNLTAYRGKCVLEKEFILMVGATPKLASVDSIGLDDVMINMESDGDYQYIVDGKYNASNIADNVKTHVGFGKHTLRIIDIAGCITDTSFTVVEPPFEIQNVFNPNSDGKDATFRIPDAVIVYPGTTMSIYDRWGKKITTLTSSDEEGWDGTYNGKPMPSADYWYDLNVDAIDKNYFGHFTLIRD